MDVKTALNDLETEGYFVWDAFLSAKEVSDIRADYQMLFEVQAFRSAGTGNALVSSDLNQSIRRDKTYWLDPEVLSAAQSVFWEKLEALKKEINERFFLGLWNLEGHYSHYPVGGYYQKHLDRFHSDDRRVISMVIYLNETWAPADGGELRIHFSGDKLKTLDVAPIAGRLVCFLSEKILHEVLVTQKVRMSFAGWWTRRA
jgi:SM-20-related protein